MKSILPINVNLIHHISHQSILYLHIHIFYLIKKFNQPFKIFLCHHSIIPLMSFSKTLQRFCKTFQAPFPSIKMQKKNRTLESTNFYHIYHEVTRTTHSVIQVCLVTLSSFRDIRNKESILPTEK